MRNPKSKKNKFPRKRKRDRFADEANEIEILNSWIESGKPESGWNPLSADPLPANAPIGRTDEGAFSPYSGCKLFAQMPLSNRTKDGLSESDYTKMTDIQRASLPHSLCGRDILGAAKTGSGKTLAFVIPVLEKLYRERWGKEDGVGSIIITPTRELASQIFEVLNAVGKHHDFSSGLLIGGRKDVGTEKEHVNDLNILVCTPGRLLQHMDETPNFDCSQLQVLVLDEADRILDIGFKQALNAIISQLPKQRQTLLFSATQTKSVQDLARLSLKDPEYISVHEKSETATPSRLQQTAIIVPREQKLDMLWSFIKANRKSNILVFLSTCKQVKFVFEAFKKLHPGIPLKCLHGRMKQDRRMAIYSQFCEQRSVLFSTDVASRGLDFNKAVDWVVQVDCPEDVASYIHRVGRTARYNSGGRSVLFLSLSEEQMLKKLQSAKIPLQFREVNTKRLRPVSSLLAAKLVEYPDLRYLAQRAFATYLKSIHKQKDKEIFDVMKLPIKAFAASLGLPMTPKIRFLNQKNKGKTTPIETSSQHVNDVVAPISEVPTEIAAGDEPVTEEEEAVESDLLSTKATQMDVGDHGDGNTAMPGTRILKNKKLKINQHRPWGTRKVFDEEGNALPPLAALADLKSGNGILQLDKVKERFRKLKEEKEEWDKEDKRQNKQRLREKKNKEKMKLKRAKEEESEAYQEEEEISGSDVEENVGRAAKRSKKYFGSDSDNGEKETKLKSNISTDAISLAEQEELALKLLSSMHS